MVNANQESKESVSSPHNGTNGHASSYVIPDAPTLPDRPFRVVCIGAGLSGIYLGIKLPFEAKNVELCIYEKNPDVGGTWYENRYPGAACDIPAHRYCYTFEPNPDWTTFYAPAGEIQKYFAQAAHKYGAMDYIKLEHKVIAAEWSEDKGSWLLKVANPQGQTIEDECDVLINGMGVLNNWKWPTIPGLKKYKGQLLHSANWNDGVDLKGKRVAVIGSGSSAIQIIPTIRPETEHLTAYLRSNTWILPPFANEILKRDENGDLILEYSEEDRRSFRDDEDALLKHRKLLEKDVSRAFRMFMKDDPSQPKMREFLVEYMKKRMAKKPELAERMIPSWPVGCRRLTPGIGFLEALCEDDVSPIFQDIASIDETGITTADGTHEAFDAIICATGFDVSYSARFPFVGRNGAQLGAEYAQNPTSYLALATPGFPNYFTFNGPNAPVGAGSLVPATEAQGDYMVKAILKLQKQGIKTMEVQQQAVNDFVEHTDKYMPRTVWSTGCRSWYKNGKIDGRVTALWPGSGLSFIDTLRDPRWEDYRYTYQDPTNRFAYLGDGFTELEHNEGDRTADLGEKTRRFLGHPALRKLKKGESVVVDGGEYLPKAAEAT